MATTLRSAQGLIEISRGPGKSGAQLKGIQHGTTIYIQITVTRRVQFVGQFHIDPLTSAVPGARLTTRNKGPVNMEKYVKSTRSHRVDREKPKHNFRFEPYSAKGANAVQRRQDWKQTPREEKYGFISVVELIPFGLTVFQGSRVHKWQPAMRNKLVLQPRLMLLGSIY